MNPARLHAYLLLLIATAIWGIATPVIKFTLDGFDALTFLTYRFGISSLIAIASFAILGLHAPKKIGTILEVFVFGFLASTVSLGLLFFGLENTTVLDSSLITLIVPLAVSGAGVYFLHEHVTKRERLGIGIALVGTIITIVEPLIQNGHSQLRLSGNLMMVGYVIATVFATVLGKRLLQKGVSPLVLTNFSFIIGFITLLPFFLYFNPSPSQWGLVLGASPIYHAGVLYMALLSGSLAYYFNNVAQKSIEVGEQALFSYLYPVFSIPLAVVWLHEKITPAFVVGSIVIAIGVFLAEIKKRRYN